MEASPARPVSFFMNCTHLDVASRGCVMDGIGEQYTQHLTEQVCVCLHERDVGLLMDDYQLQIVRFSQNYPVLSGFGKQIVQIDRFYVEFNLALIQTRKPQKVLD